MDKDLATTILGGVMAAVTAAQPAIAASNGNFNTANILQLLFAVAMGIFGFFTNKKGGA